jgi:hypothetical protein
VTRFGYQPLLTLMKKMTEKVVKQKKSGYGGVRRVK